MVKVFAIGAVLVLAGSASVAPASAENKCTTSYSCTVSTTPGQNGQPPQPQVSCSITVTCK